MFRRSIWNSRLGDVGGHLPLNPDVEPELFHVSTSHSFVIHHVALVGMERANEGKERRSIYIVPFILRMVSMRSSIDHTVLPANYTMPVFSS